MTFTLVRQLLFTDAGRNLAHLEKQLRSGNSISTELTGCLKERSL